MVISKIRVNSLPTCATVSYIVDLEKCWSKSCWTKKLLAKKFFGTVARPKIVDLKSCWSKNCRPENCRILTHFSDICRIFRTIFVIFVGPRDLNSIYTPTSRAFSTPLGFPLRDGSKFIGYPGRDHRQGGEDFFSKKNRGAKTFFL